MSGGELARKQARALGLDGGKPIRSPADAERFLSRVGIALRYGPARGLPLASLYLAFAGPEADKPALTRAIELTNGLLGDVHAIEVHVIAERVALVHRALMPSLYALVRRGRSPDEGSGLGVGARAALILLEEQGEVTAGEVRRRLGARFDARHDPAYEALAELTRRLLVDRGPFRIPRSGIPYLSREGYPYHFFHEAHPDLTRAAARLSPTAAACEFLGAYLRAAVFAPVGKLATLFKVFLSPAEIDAALQRLVREGRVEIRGAGRATLAVSASEA